MGTEILKSFGTLQSELEQARDGLKFVDESIKRLIGRDPSDIPRPVLKRGPPVEENRPRQRGGPLSVRARTIIHENDEPPVKRRNGSVFKRLSERPVHYEEETVQQPQRQLISKVIVTPKEVPSREEALAAQNNDEKAKARNRRMFGALLGTLQKFQQEETKLKQKEGMRAQLEKKIEEHEIKEKAEIKKERQELFFNRKKKQAEIKMIELKMLRMKDYAVWEEKQKPRTNFIQTKTQPHICYLPRKLNDTTKALLEECKKDVETMLDQKRQEICDELQHIEERMKRNFEPKKSKEDETDKEELNEENPEVNEETAEAAPESVSTAAEETNESSVVPEEQKMDEGENKNEENTESVVEEKSAEENKQDDAAVLEQQVENSVTIEKTSESEEVVEKMDVV